jgi:hypothetical protein
MAQQKKLQSRVCEILEIDRPIVLAGMGGASSPALAAAVSNAGGLGVLGAAACGPRQLREWIRQTREMTDKPFGVDTLLPASVRRASYDDSEGPTPADLLPERQAFAEEFMRKEGIDPLEARSRQRGPDDDEPALFTKEFFEAQMEVIIQERVPVYASGLGNPGPWMSELRANGTKVMAVVGAVRHAIQVKSSGLDIIVAQGHDGGGHNSPVGTMALIPQVVDAVGDTPVLGAGGISDGRGVACSPDARRGRRVGWFGFPGLGRSQYFRFPEAGHSRCNGRGNLSFPNRDGQASPDHSLQVDRALAKRGRRASAHALSRHDFRARLWRPPIETVGVISILDLPVRALA